MVLKEPSPSFTPSTAFPAASCRGGLHEEEEGGERWGFWNKILGDFSFKFLIIKKSAAFFFFFEGTDSLMF